MRRIFLSVLLGITTVVSAQKVNNRGEKIVSKIEILNYAYKRGNLYEKSVIDYQYKNSHIYRVNKYTIDCTGGDIRTGKNRFFNDMYEISNNSLRKIYRRDNKDNEKQDFDCENFLVKTKRIHFSDAEVSGYIKYDYLYDNNYILFMKYRWYVKYHYEKNLKGGEDKYEIKFEWCKNNMYVDRFNMSYSNKINDTNIDFATFLMFSDNRGLFGNDGFIYSTELFGNKSVNLIKNIKGFEIENIFFNNNLTEIRVIRSKDKILCKAIKVYYLH